MRCSDQIVNEMEFRMSRACNGMSPQLQATTMKGFYVSSGVLGALDLTKTRAAAP
jgi:hypothetical protein